MKQSEKHLNSNASAISFLQELRALIRGFREEVRALRDEVIELQEPNFEGPAPLLTREEAADRLSISIRTLDDLAARGDIRPVRIRGRVLYSLETLNAFIRRSTRGGSRHE